MTSIVWKNIKRRTNFTFTDFLYPLYFLTYSSVNLKNTKFLGRTEDDEKCPSSEKYCEKTEAWMKNPWTSSVRTIIKYIWWKYRSSILKTEGGVAFGVKTTDISLFLGKISFFNLATKIIEIEKWSNDQSCRPPRVVYACNVRFLWSSPLGGASGRLDFWTCRQTMFGGLPFENYDR